ncbi:MAG: septation protein A [Gammaproteobacteria bacterium]|nr:septation protein A [Gammaproteobacteria bacterium]NIR81655.1 septation protein A [Gammaproteobacteria bacterium]NIR88206.1 septation protein A [Gammaproteobacteria bacterium]NIU02767.1 septation protein A [Gammaproteobacteria bacterium]NIV73366.1 septation protein A [Gammaproteobacteria bacterium]
MKALFDFFPVVAFFVTFQLFDDPKEGMLAATAVAAAAACVQVLGYWLWRRQVERMHLAVLALILLLAGPTLLLEEEIFFKWKPTAVNWLFALVFLASQYVGGKPLVQRVMEKSVQVPAPVWTRLNMSWVLFFAAMGIVNLYVVYNFDTETWVNFKLFGLLGLTFAFVIAQAVYLVRHMKPEDNPEEGR